jgi:ATP-dependent helicase/nuclease subunit A
MTRAQERLHLLGEVSLKAGEDGTPDMGEPGSRTLLHQLWPTVSPVFIEAANRLAASGIPAGEEERKGAINQELRRIASGWTAPAAPARVAWTPPPDPARMSDELEFSWAGETARRIGSVVHRWLQQIADAGLSSWDAKRIDSMRATFEAELLAAGLPPSETAAAAGRVASILEQTLGDERGRWLLGPHDDAQSELRLTGVAGDGIVNVVMDRSFVDEKGVRWIVDYKTGGHEGGEIAAFLDREQERYRPQLERYAALMKARDGRPVKLGLYFPLLKGWRELESKG